MVERYITWGHISLDVFLFPSFFFSLSFLKIVETEKNGGYKKKQPQPKTQLKG